MRISTITMQFPSPSETFAATDISALVRAGADVTVFAMRPKHKKDAKMKEERGLQDIPVFSYNT
ncbi:MAG: hypothetical protein R6U19_01605, partial [Bacteroidales bacterium]